MGYKHELSLIAELERAGHTCIKKGWPDLFCFLRDGRPVVIELKYPHIELLTPEQRRTMIVLASYGVTCYVLTPYRLVQVVGEALVERSRADLGLKLRDAPLRRGRGAPGCPRPKRTGLRGQMNRGAAPKLK